MRILSMSKDKQMEFQSENISNINLIDDKY